MRSIIDSFVQNFAVANLRRRPEPVEIGGFVVGIDPSTTSHHVNYATPLPGIEPTSADVAALISAFRERGLKPRLEFAPNAAPAVESALYGASLETSQHGRGGTRVSGLRAGHLCHARQSAIRGDASDGRGLYCRRHSVAIDTALSEAFDNEFPPSPEGAARLRRTQEMGGVRFVRAPEGGCAGGAMCSAPAVGTSEPAGVGTRPAYRGKGIAAAVTATLTESMFAKGNESVWLEHGGDGSRRVYERIALS